MSILVNKNSFSGIIFVCFYSISVGQEQGCQLDKIYAKRTHCHVPGRNGIKGKKVTYSKNLDIKGQK